MSSFGQKTAWFQRCRLPKERRRKELRRERDSRSLSWVRRRHGRARVDWLLGSSTSTPRISFTLLGFAAIGYSLGVAVPLAQWGVRGRPIVFRWFPLESGRSSRRSSGAEARSPLNLGRLAASIQAALSGPNELVTFEASTRRLDHKSGKVRLDHAKWQSPRVLMSGERNRPTLGVDSSGNRAQAHDLWPNLWSPFTFSEGPDS